MTVADGNLRITATNQPLANKLYRSGLVTSKALYGPGRFEARIDLPTTQGMWPAFWLNAEPGCLAAGRRDRHYGKQGQPADAYEQCLPLAERSGAVLRNRHYVFDEYTATSGGNPVNFHNRVPHVRSRMGHDAGFAFMSMAICTSP